jgi:hypothetical protein
VVVAARAEAWEEALHLKQIRAAEVALEKLRRAAEREENLRMKA